MCGDGCCILADWCMASSCRIERCVENNVVLCPQVENICPAEARIEVRVFSTLITMAWASWSVYIAFGSCFQIPIAKVNLVVDSKGTQQTKS